MRHLVTGAGSGIGAALAEAGIPILGTTPGANLYC